MTAMFLRWLIKTARGREVEGGAGVIGEEGGRAVWVGGLTAFKQKCSPGSTVIGCISFV